MTTGVYWICDRICEKCGQYYRSDTPHICPQQHIYQHDTSRNKFPQQIPLFTIDEMNNLRQS